MYAINSGDAATFASVGVAAVALVVSIISTRHSHASARASERSADAAEISADAAAAAADAAARTARADETIAQIESDRHRLETERLDVLRREAEDAPKRAVLSLRTERYLDPNRTFGTPDEGFKYFLVIDNTGSHKASNLSINNLACDGWGTHDFPATADTSQIASLALIPTRTFRLRLQSCGERNSWDIAECTVRWEDGLGTHDARLPVARTW